MIELIDIVKNMMSELQSKIADSARLCNVEHTFIERVTFASRDELLALLDIIEGNYWTEFPIWARNLVYRLIDLQQPQDPRLKQRMSASLRSFGPDWDQIAERLESEARNLDKDSRTY